MGPNPLPARTNCFAGIPTQGSLAVNGEEDVTLLSRSSDTCSLGSVSQIVWQYDHLSKNNNGNSSVHSFIQAIETEYIPGCSAFIQKAPE
jgi:hypothetical protein